MSSSTSFNTQIIEYPTFPSISAPFFNENSDSSDQRDHQTDGGFNPTSNNNSIGIIFTGRQTRSSGPAPNISLESLARISAVPLDSLVKNDRDPEQRRTQITRIIDGDEEKSFSDYYIRTVAEMIEVHRLLFLNVNANKQRDDEWK